MTSKRGVGGGGDSTSTRNTPIVPLPEEVVAQIKSSTAILSLTAVLLELLANSLDARATKIEATVDFTRGGCSVEDNGLGIAPLEFQEGGGLGRLYCTSKHYSQGAYLGRNGIFLASLASMSLLTIVSRHHEHRSLSLLSFHHSKVIDRQLPAQPQHEIHERHGTRVTVRNLFGNLPVRVKQRAVTAENKAEYDRLWDVLKRDVTCLMLSWQGQVALRIRSSDGKTSLSFSGMHRLTPSEGSGSAELRQMLNLLTQANLITYDEWSSWVPASVTTSIVSIKGAISLKPAPSKHAQFISLGIRPLWIDSGHNEVFDEVNRIFALSSFGAIDDDAELSGHDKARRKDGRRFKNDGYTNRQLKARKGVDRYPMFYLRILLKDVRGAKHTDMPLLNDENLLNTVMEVLTAMITQWLSVHHFRPRNDRTKKAGPSTASTSVARESGPEEQVSPDADVPNVNETRFSSPGSATPTSSRPKRNRTSQAGADTNPGQARLRPFSEWSRIKSANAEFFGQSSIKTQNEREKLSGASISAAANAFSQANTPSASFATFELPTLMPGSLNNGSIPQLLSNNESCSEDEKHDRSVTWRDPTTKQVFVLNARTGCVLPQLPVRPHSDSLPHRQSSLRDFNKPMRLQARPATASKGRDSWLDDVLQSWDNPVFKPIEPQIQQSSLYRENLECQGHSDPRKRLDTELSGALAFSINRLSKAGLQAAQVLAQLDKKFVLAKMYGSTKTITSASEETELLVIIDQHAADERVRVEALFAELCSPVLEDKGHSGYRSKLGHQSAVAFVILEKPMQFTVSPPEVALFTTYAGQFAAWGILFDISKQSAHITSEKAQANLVVTTLPPAVSERCKADPQLLISFLRSAVWKYADNPNLTPLATDGLLRFSDDENQTAWVRRLSSCPEGLIDLINSRACRSAIMFNDELSLAQCKELVDKLARCVFPFMCAHGRPSMVPLVDLGTVGGLSDALLTFSASKDHSCSEKNFIHAWKDWKRK